MPSTLARRHRTQAGSTGHMSTSDICRCEDNLQVDSTGRSNIRSDRKRRQNDGIHKQTLA
jgi:hypothetical protein